MGLIQELQKAEHSTLAFFAKEYQKIHGAEPEIQAVADRALPYVGALLQVVVSAEAGAPAGALVGSAMSTIQRDIDVAGAVIADTGANPTAASLVGSIASNISNLATATGIKNAASLAVLNKAVATASQLAQALAPPPPVLPAASPGPVAA